MDTRILIIDDEEFICQTIADYFEDQGFVCRMANNGSEGLEALKAFDPDVVLSDLRMPVMDGFEVLEHLSRDYPELPVVVVSGVGVLGDALRAVRLGAWDFVTKPIQDMSVLEHRVNNVLERAELQRQNRRYREHLEEEVRLRTDALREEANERLKAQEELHKISQEIITTQKELILLLGDVVEHRSRETANHVRRVAEICYMLAVKVGLGEKDSDILRMAAPMHDVGKVAISDAILNKPGKLTSEEFEIIKSHTVIGYDILNHSERRLMKTAATVALQHHERWDGKGYPQGLAGEEIHIYGRITAIADVFDALAQKRVYKDAWPMEKILDLFKRGRGTQFDPNLVDIMLDNLDEIDSIMKRFPDTSQS